MTRSLCFCILYPRTNCFDDLMLHKKFCVFVDFSSRESEELRELISLEEISGIHSKCAHIFEEVLMFFFEQFLFHNCTFIFEIFDYCVWIIDMSWKMSEINIGVTKRIHSFDIGISRENISNFDPHILRFCIFSKADSREDKVFYIIFYFFGGCEYYCIFERF